MASLSENLGPREGDKINGFPSRARRRRRLRRSGGLLVRESRHLDRISDEWRGGGGSSNETEASTAAESQHGWRMW